MSFQIQNIKSEPLEKEAEDFSNIFFDYENKIPIKEEIKQEIKIEPFVNEYNMDVENHVTSVRPIRFFSYRPIPIYTDKSHF